MISVTALVLGGTSLAGGRATVLGSLLGALNLSLIGYVLSTLDLSSVQGFVTDLSYGVILVLSLLMTVALPYLHRWLRYVSPLLVFVALGSLFTGVALHATYDYSALSPHGGVRATSPMQPADASGPAPPPAAAAPGACGSPRLCWNKVEPSPNFLRSLISDPVVTARSAAPGDRRRVAADSGLAGQSTPDHATALCGDRHRRRTGCLAADGHWCLGVEARALRKAGWRIVPSSPR